MEQKRDDRRLKTYTKGKGVNMKNPRLTVVLVCLQSVLLLCGCISHRTGNSTVKFGPVRERVLPLGVPCMMYYFQIRNGEVFVIGHGPDTKKAEFDADNKKIVAAGGADLSANGSKAGIQLAGEGCLFTRELHDLSWEGTAAEDVVEKMSQVRFVVEPKSEYHTNPFAPVTAGGAGIVQPTAADFPITYLFKTARGEVGIMEVEGVVEDERGVSGDGKGDGMKFRYKLVQPADAIAAQ